MIKDKITYLNVKIRSRSILKNEKKLLQLTMLHLLQPLKPLKNLFKLRNNTCYILLLY